MAEPPSAAAGRPPAEASDLRAQTRGGFSNQYDRCSGWSAMIPQTHGSTHGGWVRLSRRLRCHFSGSLEVPNTPSLTAEPGRASTGCSQHFVMVSCEAELISLGRTLVVDRFDLSAVASPLTLEKDPAARGSPAEGRPSLPDLPLAPP